MCDYYDFSDELMDFIENIKIRIEKKIKNMFKSKKNKLNKILNLEIVIHFCKWIEINIFTEYTELFEMFQNELKQNQDELIILCKHQSYIYPNYTILYNHIFNVEKFEKTLNRNVYYDCIVKYYA